MSSGGRQREHPVGVEGRHGPPGLDTGGWHGPPVRGRDSAPASDATTRLEHDPAAVVGTLGGGRGPSAAGASPRDAGARPRDAGARPRDAGARPRDAGASPRDAGARPRDAGASARDAGATARADDDPPDVGPGPLVIGPARGVPPSGEVLHVPQPRYEAVYFVLATLFVSLLVLTNVIGTKLFVLPLEMPVLGPWLRAVDRFTLDLFGWGGGDGLTLTAGIITYPFTFLITDIVSETWGRRRADVMVLLGFGASLLMLLVISVAGGLEPSPVWKLTHEYAHVLAPAYQVAGIDAGGAPVLEGSHEAAQAAYRFTFDAPGTLLLASMTAYLVAQLVDNRLFHFWRRLTRGRALWFRNNMSTMLSQLVDTIIVNGIFLHFYWKMGASAIAGVIVSVYAIKFLFALLDTPFCYLGVWLVQRSLDPRSGSDA